MNTATNRTYALIKQALRRRHAGSGAWGVFDAGVMGWRATDLLENEAQHEAADLSVSSISTGSETRVITNRFDPPIEVNQQPGQLEARD